MKVISSIFIDVLPERQETTGGKKGRLLEGNANKRPTVEQHYQGSCDSDIFINDQVLAGSAGGK